MTDKNLELIKQYKHYGKYADEVKCVNTVVEANQEVLFNQIETGIEPDPMTLYTKELYEANLSKLKIALLGSFDSRITIEEAIEQEKQKLNN